ncbi:putative transmembrane protein [Crotalus adamanteus]|uniref:Transmembrane protein n=1 Tax=Crotalus adamanteus TaxID=8729 RepID=A0AAW1B0U4_CROAD
MVSSGLNHCRLALAFAVFMDAAGTGTLLTGIFARLRLRGRDFGDLLIYLGAVLVFLSLLGWIMWYTGNIARGVSLSCATPPRRALRGQRASLKRAVVARLPSTFSMIQIAAEAVQQDKTTSVSFSAPEGGN